MQLARAAAQGTRPARRGGAAASAHARDPRELVPAGHARLAVASSWLSGEILKRHVISTRRYSPGNPSIAKACANLASLCVVRAHANRRREHDV